MAIEGKVLAVVGSRKFPDPEFVRKWVLKNADRFDWFVSGGAEGPDKIAEKAWVEAKGSRDKVRVYKADWERYKGYAGMMRNLKIIASATFIVCFWTDLSAGSMDDIGLTLGCGKPMNLYVRN